MTWHGACEHLLRAVALLSTTGQRYKLICAGGWGLPSSEKLANPWGRIRAYYSTKYTPIYTPNYTPKCILKSLKPPFPPGATPKYTPKCTPEYISDVF